MNRHGIDMVIFTGPTLSAARVRELAPGAVVAPPAAHGDVLRWARSRPRAIGIVDGVFDRLPSVWHKEVLWALSSGVHVYGAASMGALRARELAVFGMRGVGEIYEAYARDELEDDDEVAVLHGGAGDDHRSLSDAMVDIRTTLRRASEAGVVDAPTVEALVAAAKELHYVDRRLPDLVRPHAELAAWVAVHHRSQKTADAVAMVRRMASDLAESSSPPAIDWTFQHTQYWDTAFRRIVAESASGHGGSIHDASELDDVGQLLDESRLDPDEFRRVEERALLALLAAHEVQREGVHQSDRLLDTATREAMQLEGVTTREQLANWLEARDLGDDDLAWIRRRWLELRYVRGAFERALPGAVVRELSLSGRTPDLVARAERKRSALAGADRRHAPPGPQELVDWYFSDIVGIPVPSHLDLWCKRQGWRDVSDLLRALGREWVFRRRESSEAAPDGS